MPSPETLAFVRRIALFAAPLVAIAAPFEWALWRTGESLPIDDVVSSQVAAGESAPLFGRRILSQQFNRYKLAGLRAHQPRILAIGSSRAMQLRRKHFGRHAPSFYNAGGLLQGWPDLMRFLDMLEHGDIPAPEVVVLVLDPWWFSAAGPPTWLVDQRLGDVADDPSAHVAAYRRLFGADARWSHMARTPLSRTHDNGIGLDGKAGNGFRADGSMRYGTHLEDRACHPGYRDSESPPITTRVAQRSHQFQQLGFQDERGAVLAQRLASSSARFVVVLGPVSNEVEALMQQDVELQTWWLNYLGLAHPLRAAGVGVVEAATPSHITSTDEVMFDGVHPSEVFWSGLMPEIAQALPTLYLPLGDGWVGPDAVNRAASPLSVEEHVECPGRGR